MSSVSPSRTQVGWPNGHLRNFNLEPTNTGLLDPRATTVIPSFYPFQWGGDANAWLRDRDSSITGNNGLFVNVPDNSTGVLYRSAEGWPGEASVRVGTSWFEAVCPGASIQKNSGFWVQEMEAFVLHSRRALTGIVFYTQNCLTWSECNALQANLRDLAWSSELNLFVAVGNSGTGNRVSVSRDLLTFTRLTGIPDQLWETVTWGAGAGLFVATASATTIMTSPDGLTWTGRNVGITVGNTVKWIPELSLFVAGSSAATGIQTSPDGINWTNQASAATDSGYNCIAWSPKEGLLIVGSASSSSTDTFQLIVSRDGINWEAVTPSSKGLGGASVGFRISTINWVEGLNLFFMVVSATFAVNDTFIFTSPDGFDWTPRPCRGRTGQHIIWSPTLRALLLTTSGNPNRIWYSGL